MLLISDVVAIAVRSLFISLFNIRTKMRHLCDKQRLIYHNKTSLQHILRNKPNNE